MVWYYLTLRTASENEVTDVAQDKKKGVQVRVVDLETGRELFSQEVIPEFALCCCTTCCWHHSAGQSQGEGPSATSRR